MVLVLNSTNLTLMLFLSNRSHGIDERPPEALISLLL